MKITFISNYFNHHQSSLALALYDLLGEDYRFVATMSVPEFRVKLGYQDMNKDYPFIHRAYENEEEKKKAQGLADTSDVVIIGNASDAYIKNRLKQGKLTFKATERLHKKKMTPYQWGKAILRILLYHARFQNKNLHILAASAYVAYDFSLFHCYQDKIYKFGYFPATKLYDLPELMRQKEEGIVKLLWVGRLIGWKRFHDVLFSVKRLRDKGYMFELEVVGDGEEKENLVQIATELGLRETVCFSGAVPVYHVRGKMEEANILLVSSDFNEGWGAVLNEGMNSACAVVASHAVGAAPFLIEHHVNGLLYEMGNVEDMAAKLEYLLTHPKDRARYGENAYHSITDCWNGAVVANRLVEVCSSLIQGESTELYSTGPLSFAPVIKNNWIHKGQVIR